MTRLYSPAVANLLLGLGQVTQIQIVTDRQTAVMWALYSPTHLCKRTLLLPSWSTSEINRFHIARPPDTVATRNRWTALAGIRERESPMWRTIICCKLELIFKTQERWLCCELLHKANWHVLNLCWHSWTASSARPSPLCWRISSCSQCRGFVPHRRARQKEEIAKKVSEVWRREAQVRHQYKTC